MPLIILNGTALKLCIYINYDKKKKNEQFFFKLICLFFIFMHINFFRAILVHISGILVQIYVLTRLLTRR
jgi:hypothetical protein